MGRDHTIFALQKGFVRYYRDPERHKERKYIGVVLEQGMALPRGRNGSRWRRLGMVGVPIEEAEVEEAGAEEAADGPLWKKGEEGVVVAGSQVKGANLLGTKPHLELKKNYMYRESNWSIGRAAERAGVKVPEYDPKDRFLAWRKTQARRARNAEKRGLRRKK